MALAVGRGTKEIIRYIKGDIGRTQYRAQRRETSADCKLQILGSWRLVSRKQDREVLSLSLEMFGEQTWWQTTGNSVHFIEWTIYSKPRAMNMNWMATMSYCARYCANKYYVLGLGPPGALISVFPDGEIRPDGKRHPLEWWLQSGAQQVTSRRRWVQWTAEAQDRACGPAYCRKDAIIINRLWVLNPLS